jgi:hypothetical protein
MLFETKGTAPAVPFVLLACKSIFIKRSGGSRPAPHLHADTRRFEALAFIAELSRFRSNSHFR